MNKKVKKLHHFLPRFYLRGFAASEEGCIEQYFLADDKIVNSHVNDAGAEKFLYSIKTDEHEKDDKVENMFSEFESSMAPAISKARENPNSLTDFDKEWIIQFVVFQYLRTPESIARARDVIESKIYEQIEELAKDDKRLKRAFENSKDYGHTLGEMKAYMLKKQEAYKVVISQNHLLGNILNLYGTVFPIMFYLNWKILEAPHNHFFITSDFPVSTIIPSPTGHGCVVLSGAIGNPHSEIAIPLSSKYCLTANRSGSHYFKHVKVSARTVNFLNTRTIACANKFLYGKTFSRDMADLILKCKSTKQEQGLDQKDNKNDNAA